MSGMQLAILGPAERDQLAELERVVDRGLATFVEVGQALLRIRDGRLYREGYSTFEAYCRERWSFSVAQGKRLIAAAEVVDAVAPIGAVPATESVARELAPLRSEPEQLREAWSDALDRNGDGPTAAQVREAVEKRRPRPVRPPALRPTPAPAPPPPGALGVSPQPGEPTAVARMRRATEILSAVIEQDMLSAEDRDQWVRLGRPYLDRLDTLLRRLLGADE